MSGLISPQLPEQSLYTISEKSDTISEDHNKNKSPATPTIDESLNNSSQKSIAIQNNLDKKSIEESSHYSYEKSLNANKIKFNQGRWTPEEHFKFIEGIIKYGNNWRMVQKNIMTRSSTQARSHAQKFFMNCKKVINSSNTKEKNRKKIIEIFESYISKIIEEDEDDLILTKEGYYEKIEKMIINNENTSNNCLNPSNLEINKANDGNDSSYLDESSSKSVDNDCIDKSNSNQNYHKKLLNDSNDIVSCRSSHSKIDLSTKKNECYKIRRYSKNLDKSGLSKIKYTYNKQSLIKNNSLNHAINVKNSKVPIFSIKKIMRKNKKKVKNNNINIQNIQSQTNTIYEQNNNMNQVINIVTINVMNSDSDINKLINYTNSNYNNNRCSERKNPFYLNFNEVDDFKVMPNPPFNGNVDKNEHLQYFDIFSDRYNDNYDVDMNIYMRNCPYNN